MSLPTSIRKNRFHSFSVGSSDNSLKPGQRVKVKQTRHKFLFGSNVFALVRNAATGGKSGPFEELHSAVFNAGTLPFYWGRYEPVEGKPFENETKTAAGWCKQNGIATKGHPLCWHTVCADWLMAYDNDTIVSKQLDRITRDVGTFRGLIDTWDVVNEAVIMPVFDKYDNAVTRICNHLGVDELVTRCFKRAREANPDAVLLINDFNLSPKYEELIARLLDKGCPIDVIGLQTHQHLGYHGAEYTNDVIDRFSRFGKPLHFTEATILSGHPVPQHIVDLNDYQVTDWPSTPEGEERQLKQAEEYYSTIFARPEVDALIWWDLIDGSWLNAPSGLVRRDMSPKPAYQRLKDLIKGEWWFGERELVSDSSGRVNFEGPEGDYELSVNGTTRKLVLDKKKLRVDVSAQ